MWFFYDSTGARIGVQQGNVTAYYMYNLQGDVVGLADAATGKIIAKSLYDACGKCVSVENADGYTIGTANPFRYRGYYYDTETGFYYVTSRYYDPEICRFINADGQINGNFLGMNLFAYCENNPVNNLDPRGESALGVAVVAAVLLCLLSGCSSKDAKAPNGYISYGRTKDVRCYSYALSYLGLSDMGKINPGTYSFRINNTTNYNYGSSTFTINDIANRVSADFTALGYDYKVYSDYDNVPSNEDCIVIAVFIYEHPKEGIDYHFAIQLPNGQWADKPGAHPSRFGVLNFNGEVWDDGANINAYCEDTRFFVVRRLE